jgi:DNA invertase Pin-like site-specific DNA recombinase
VKRLRRMTVPHDRPIGRPFAASEKQRVDVRNRRKAGESLRAIAHATNLSVRSVRTVIEKRTGQ